MRIFNLIITTKKKQDDFIIACMQRLEKVNNLSTWAAINPVIHDLEKLRANTWDQDKITKIQNRLKDSFEVKNDS
jgi:hypothetical protein